MNKDWEKLSPVLQDILDDEIANGNEAACQLCIFDHGEKVIDLAAGKNVDTESLFPIFSAGKPILASIAWLLVEKGLLTYDTPIGKFWQEFDTPEKSGITLDHLLSHRAGMYLLPKNVDDWTNWEAMCKGVANMTPRNAPGEKCHYHPLTFAWLLGHTLELVCATPLPRLIKETVIEPLGLQGKIYFGTDAQADKRTVAVDDCRIAKKPAWEAVTMNNENFRHSCIPSFNGIASAAGLAEFYSKLRGGLVSNGTFDYASGKLFRRAEDQINPSSWAKFALGVVLPGPEDNRRMFVGHGGAAGAEGFYMPYEDVAFGFVKNRLSPNHPDHPIRDRISAALDIPPRFW